MHVVVHVQTLFMHCCFRELSHSRSMSFPEKKSYKPHINIEYVDDKGRDLTPKEVYTYATKCTVMVSTYCLY